MKYTNKKVIISGKILEHLQNGKNEWFDVELENGAKLTINKKYCKIVDDK